MKFFYHKSGDDVKIATMYVSTHKVAMLAKHYIVKYFENVLYIE